MPLFRKYGSNGLPYKTINSANQHIETARKQEKTGQIPARKGIVLSSFSLVADSFQWEPNKAIRGFTTCNKDGKNVGSFGAFPMRFFF